MMFTGGGDFEKVGQEFKQYLVELADLRPHERVLDVGCGIGRMAVPLTQYLTKNAEYRGFDLVKERLDWCRQNISSRFGNFHFQHVDIYNKNYNPTGKIRAGDFRFPFKSGCFDVVLLASVFTHMLPRDVEAYLSEISRVLARHGRCLLSLFLLNGESEDMIAAGRSTQMFRFQVDECLTIDADNPEAAIAYREEAFLRLLARYNMTLHGPVRYGSWCGRSAFLSYQDILVAVRNGG
jgi:SAM-dependent methyltransferase